jgi:carbonic anhydrase
MAIRSARIEPTGIRLIGIHNDAGRRLPVTAAHHTVDAHGRARLVGGCDPAGPIELRRHAVEHPLTTFAGSAQDRLPLRLRFGRRARRQEQHQGQSGDAHEDLDGLTPRSVAGLIYTPGMLSALDALDRLREGNQRFVSDLRNTGGESGQARRRQVAEAQEPFAIILGCSDSRVPAEIVFDQGLGDLFVIRVAGNIVAPSQVGSVEFAADRFQTRLVVVLGHSNCGAIQATIEELGRPTGDQSRNLRSIVERIEPCVRPLMNGGPSRDPGGLVEQAVRANIRASANHLRHGSEVLEQLIQTNGLLVVGAEYSLETGVVDFFDGVPDKWNAE